jgi:hypothetical protein
MAEFQLEVERIQQDYIREIKRRLTQEGDWGRAYLVREMERWILK